MPCSHGRVTEMWGYGGICVRLVEQKKRQRRPAVPSREEAHTARGGLVPNGVVQRVLQFGTASSNNKGASSKWRKAPFRSDQARYWAELVCAH